MKQGGTFSLISPAMSQKVHLFFFYKDGFHSKQPNKSRNDVNSISEPSKFLLFVH